MSELIGIYLMLFLLYVGGAVTTGYLCGLVEPNLSFDSGSLTACVFWPIGLPIALAVLAYKQGQAHVRYVPLKRGEPDSDGWHDYEDGNMLVKWKEKE